MQDAIERSAVLKATPARVWRALSDHREFGAWFRLEADRPFTPGAEVACRCTYPGLEHLTWRMIIVALEPERRLTFRWPAYYGEDYEGDPADDPWLEVNFLIEPVAGGTRLTIRETGFSKLPPDRAPTAFRMNEGGWDEQVRNIAAHVEA